MKLIIDIPDSDYTAVRCEALYYIGHDELAKSVTTAFQAAIPYEEQPQGKWVFDSEFTEFGNPYGTYRCSICGCHSSNTYSFCKDCGADMKGGAE